MQLKSQRDFVRKVIADEVPVCKAGTFRGMVQAGSAKLTGIRPEPLVDKLGERSGCARS